MANSSNEDHPRDHALSPSISHASTAAVDAHMPGENTPAKDSVGTEDKDKNLLNGVKVICERLVKQLDASGLDDVSSALTVALTRIDRRLHG